MTLLDEVADGAAFDDLVGLIRARQPAASVDPRMRAAMSVHRNNCRAAGLRALQETFPVVQRLVGAEFFRLAAHEYFHASPAESPLAVRYGDEFPKFLAAFEPAKKHAYLPDVARFEVEWLHSYHAAEAVSLPPDETSAMLKQARADARVNLHPSARLFASPHPVQAIWTYNREERTDDLLLKGNAVERVLIVRPEREVFTNMLSSAVFSALRSLSAGASLGRALEVGLIADPHAARGAILRDLGSLQVVIGIDSAD